MFGCGIRRPISGHFKIRAPSAYGVPASFPDIRRETCPLSSRNSMLAVPLESTRRRSRGRLWASESWTIADLSVARPRNTRRALPLERSRRAESRAGPAGAATGPQVGALPGRGGGKSGMTSPTPIRIEAEVDACEHPAVLAGAQQLAQALNRFKGKTVIASKTQVERKVDASTTN